MMQLGPAGEKLAIAVESGIREAVDLAGAEIAADILRAILLGLPVEWPGGTKSAVAITGVGLHLKGAVVVGLFDLEDARGLDGLAIAPVVLTDCVFKGEIRLAHARIRHLSLARSKLFHLDGRGLHVEGPLDLTGVSSSQAPEAAAGAGGEGQCWIELRGARIDGCLEAGGATFVAPAKRPNFVPGATRPRFALHLAEAHVRDSIILFPNVRAIGGVGLGGTEIGGDIWASGLFCRAEEYVAFFAQTARISGVAILRALNADDGGDTARFRAEGDVVFLGAHITGTLDMCGASVRGMLVIGNAAIGGDLLLSEILGKVKGRDETVRFEARGEVNLYGAKITGHLRLGAARLGGGLAGTNAAIDADVTSDWVAGMYRGKPKRFHLVVGDHFFFDGARIGGSLNLSHARFMRDLTCENAEIGGDLILTGAVLRKRNSFWGAVIDRGVELSDAVFRDSFFGSNMSVAGDLSFVNTQLRRGAFLEGIQVRQDLVFRPRSVDGNIAARNAEIRRTFLVAIPGHKAAARKGAAGTGEIDLCDARVGVLDDKWGTGFGGGQRLKLEGFHYEQMRFLEDQRLQDARWRQRLRRPSALRPFLAWPTWVYRWTVTLLRGLFQFLPVWFLPWALGVAVAAAVASSLFAWLQPYTVEAFAAVALCLTFWACREADFGGVDWLARRDWLDLQFPGGEPTAILYTPDPYERLIHAFQAAGLYNDARRAASHRLTLERRLTTFVVFRPFIWLYGFLFNYGLSPLRALGVFFFCIFVGYIAVIVADEGSAGSQAVPVLGPVLDAVGLPVPAMKSVLVIDANTVNSVAIPTGAGRGMRPGLLSPINTAPVPDEIACNNQIDPLLYAIDLFVPALEIRQETKCSVSIRPEAHGWRVARAMYSLLGWIVTSLTILTVSGILRRQAEA